MSATKLIAAPLKYKLAHPLHIRLILADVFSLESQPSKEHTAHLTAAIDWLCRAQDARGGFPDRGGVSAGWSFGDGWLPSYPETTVYICHKAACVPGSQPRPGSIIARSTAHRPETRRNRAHFAARTRRNFLSFNIRVRFPDSCQQCPLRPRAVTRIMPHSGSCAYPWSRPAAVQGPSPVQRWAGRAVRKMPACAEESGLEPPAVVRIRVARCGARGD
jgi:hypothetical protein